MDITVVADSPPSDPLEDPTPSGRPSIGPQIDNGWCTDTAQRCAQAVEDALRRGPGGPARWLRIPRGRKAASLTRLGAALARQITEARGLELTGPHAATYQGHIEDACRRLAARDADGGWDSLNAARRAGMWALHADDSARSHLAVSLRAEADNKLNDWRKAATLELLGKAGTAPDVDALQRAQAHLDEHATNVFRRLDIYRSILWFACGGLVLSQAAFFAMIKKGWLPQPSTPQGADLVLASTGGAAAIAVLGALGALLSIALSQSPTRERKLPELREGLIVNLLRPMVGSASALVLVLVLQSGAVAQITPDRQMTYVWAVVAGFSERLLRRTLDGLADTVKSAPSPTTKSSTK